MSQVRSTFLSGSDNQLATNQLTNNKSSTISTALSVIYVVDPDLNKYLPDPQQWMHGSGPWTPGPPAMDPTRRSTAQVGQRFSFSW
jgi:hypothetical protein